MRDCRPKFSRFRVVFKNGAAWRKASLSLTHYKPLPIHIFIGLTVQKKNIHNNVNNKTGFKKSSTCSSSVQLFCYGDRACIFFHS